MTVELFHCPIDLSPLWQALPGNFFAYDYYITCFSYWFKLPFTQNMVRVACQNTYNI